MPQEAILSELLLREKLSTDMFRSIAANLGYIENIQKQKSALMTDFNCRFELILQVALLDSK
jgi:hypothetical protein